MPEKNTEPMKNPTRHNKTVTNPDENKDKNEKRFESEEKSPRRRPEINPGELDKKEIDLDRDGISGSQGDEGVEFSGDENQSTEENPPKTRPPEQPGENAVKH